MSSDPSPADLQKIEEALKTMEKQSIFPTGASVNSLSDVLKGIPLPDSISAALITSQSKAYFLPASTSAVLLVGFHPADQVQQLAKMLGNRGYVVAGTHALNLVNLRNLPSKPIGVLYIHSHGSLELQLPPEQPASDTDPGAELVFGIATEDSADVPPASVGGPAGVALRADIKAGRVKDGYAEVHYPDPLTGTYTMGGGTKHVYFATDKFFSYYWKGKVFADHGLVYADACWSASGQFAATCSSAGAGMVLGWTFPVACQDAMLTSNYVFDRLLGTNNQNPGFFKETRPQRPFNWDMVVKDMKNHTYPLSGIPPNDKVGTSSTKDGPTTLLANGAGVFLVPSIMCLQVDEPNMRLQIQGDFGDKYTPPGPGTVKLYSSADRKGGSTSLNVVMWSRVMVTCALPSGSPGTSTTGTSGYVVVEVSGRESNAVPLTEWTGQILATGSGDQSIQEKGTMNFSLRGDVHLYRKDFSCPAGVSDAYAPVGTVVVGHATPYSTCDYVANGSASYSPAKNDVLEQSVTGSGRIRSVASVAAGPDATYGNVTPATGTDDDSFDMSMEIDRLLDYNLQETDTVSLGLEGLQCGPTHVDVWTKKTDTSVIGGCGFPYPDTDTTETTNQDIPALGWWTIHDLIEKQPLTSYQLPCPDIPPQDVGDGISSSPWVKAVFSMTSQTSFPPDPSKGEDCMPVLG